MNDSSTGVCLRCQHVNDREWVLCDACGARLPWAPPEKRKRTPAELTDEELALMTRPNQKPEPFFLLTVEGRPALGALIAIGVALFWMFGLLR